MCFNNDNSLLNTEKIYLIHKVKHADVPYHSLYADKTKKYTIIRFKMAVKKLHSMLSNSLREA